MPKSYDINNDSTSSNKPDRYKQSTFDANDKEKSNAKKSVAYGGETYLDKSSNKSKK